MDCASIIGLFQGCFLWGNPLKLTPLQRPPRLHMVCLIPRKWYYLKRWENKIIISSFRYQQWRRPEPDPPNFCVTLHWPPTSRSQLTILENTSAISKVFREGRWVVITKSVTISANISLMETLLAFVQHVPPAYMSLLPRLGSVKPPEELNLL